MESLLQSGYRAVSSSPQYCFILPICSQNFPTSLTLVNHRSILSSYSFDLGMSYKCNHAAATAAKSLQSCPTLRDSMDCSLQGSSVHGIFQARVLEWVAIAFSSISGLVFQFVPHFSSPLCPQVCSLVYISISTLQISSSVPFF